MPLTLDKYNRLKFADKIWPYRMAVTVQLIVQFILFCMFIIITESTISGNGNLYYLSTWDIMGLSSLFVLILMVYTFMKSLEFRSFYKDDKYLVCIISVIMGFLVGAFGYVFIIGPMLIVY